MDILLLFGISIGQVVRFQVPILDITILLLVFLGLYRLKFKLKKPPLWLIFGVIFSATSLFSLIITPLHLNFDSYLSSSFYTFRFLLYLFLGWIIYLGALSNLHQKSQKLLMFSGIILSTLGSLQLLVFPDLQFLQSSGWDPHYLRMVSTFLDPNFLACFLILIMIISLSNIHNFKKDLLPLVSFTFSFLAVFTTFSRSAAIMFFVVFLTFSLLKKSIKLLIITFLLTAILFAGYQGYEEFVSKPRLINRQQSANYRIGSWQTGIKIWQRSPIFGIGFNAYKYALKEYNLAPKEFIKSHAGSSNDSSLIFVLSTTGIIGLILYFLFLFSLLYKSTNIKIMFPGLAGLLVNSLFINSLFYAWILLWLILMVNTKGNENS